MTCPDCAAVVAENEQLKRARHGTLRAPQLPGDAALALGLTRRELDVLGLIAEGLSTAEVAGALYLSANSVKTHTRTLFQKLGVGSRLQAAVWVWSHGWDVLDDG